jgi:hypothetical protein
MDRNETIDLKGFLQLIWKWKWLVAATFLLSQAFVAYSLLHKSHRFKADTKFIFKTSSATEIPLSNLAAMVGITGGSSKGDISNYFDIIIFTDDFLAKILNRKWVLDNGDSATLDQVWDLKLDSTLKGDRDYVRLQAMISILVSGKHILVTKDARNSLVTLVTSFEGARLTYDINQYIVTLLNDYLLNNTRSQASENRKFVEMRLLEVADDLRQSEENLLAFNLRNKSISSPSLLLESVRLRRWVEINQEVYLQLKKQLELAKIDERKDSPIIEVLSRPKPPLAPEERLGKKHYVVITLGGIFFGVFLSLLLQFLIYSNTRPRSPA